MWVAYNLVIVGTASKLERESNFSCQFFSMYLLKNMAKRGNELCKYVIIL